MTTKRSEIDPLLSVYFLSLQRPSIRPEAGALDRIGRDAVRSLMTLDALQQSGVRVVSLREGLDFGGPMRRALGALLGAIAEIERGGGSGSASGAACGPHGPADGDSGARG